MNKQHEQAVLFLRKAAEDEALMDEVLTSSRLLAWIARAPFRLSV